MTKEQSHYSHEAYVARYDDWLVWRELDLLVYAMRDQDDQIIRLLEKRED